MPLFTFLSGIVYAYRPYQSDPITYTKGKIRRLLVPMLTIGTIFALLRSVTSTADQAAINLSTIHIYPVAHFWFVEAIFLIFLSMIILEKFKLFFNLKRAMAVMIVACAFYLAGTNIKIFSLDGAVYLFPYFLAGMILQRYKLIGNQHFLLTPLLLIAGLLALAFVLINTPQAEPKFTFPSLAIGLLLCSALVLTKLKNTFLAKIGTYSYTIYIFHVFFTAASRNRTK
jgi:peptidoglycan/LPS O-acetylase OafA/YrhL